MKPVKVVPLNIAGKLHSYTVINQETHETLGHIEENKKTNIWFFIPRSRIAFGNRSLAILHHKVSALNSVSRLTKEES